MGFRGNAELKSLPPEHSVILPAYPSKLQKMTELTLLKHDKVQNIALVYYNELLLAGNLFTKKLPKFVEKSPHKVLLIHTSDLVPSNLEVYI